MAQIRLTHVFWLLEVLFLCLGLLFVIFAVVVRVQDTESPLTGLFTLRRIVISNSILFGGMVLGGIIVASFAFGIFSFVRSRKISKHCTTLLHAFNWSVVATGIATVVVGCMVWVVTLRPLESFAKEWQQQPPLVRSWLQDSLHCCGYYNTTAAGLFNTSSVGFCAAVAAGTNTSAVQPCVVPINAFEDSTLNLIFTTLFGSAAVQVCLVLVTCGVIKVQNEAYRFSLIDAKRGAKDMLV